MLSGHKTWAFWSGCVLLAACAVIAVGAEADKNKPVGSITFGGEYAGVHDDEDKFREDRWIYDGLRLGIRDLETDLSRAGWDMEARGKFMQPGDYRGLVRMSRDDFGFVQLDYEEFDTYDDSSNLFYPFAPGTYDHGEDLVKTWRDATVTFGWRPPESPDVTLKYQRWEKFGERSILHGGEVTNGTVTLNRYPLYEDLDMGRNRFSAAVSDTIGGFDVKLKQTYQDMDGHNEFNSFIFDSAGVLDEIRRVDYRPKHETWLTELTAQGDIVPDLLNLEMSASYTDLEPESTYDENAFDSTGAPSARQHFNYNFVDNQHSGEGRRINWNTRLTFTPSDVWTFFGGLGYNNEYNNHHSVKNIDAPHSAQFFPGFQPGWPWTPDGVVSKRWIYDTDFQRDVWKYNGGLQVEPLSWVTARLEGKLEQNDVTYDWSGTEPIDFAAPGDRLRWVSDGQFHRTELVPSVTVRPLEDVKLIGRYKRSRVDYDYDDQVDIATSGLGYPGFIGNNDRRTREWSGLVEYRPFSTLWMTYKVQSKRKDYVVQSEPNETIGESDSLSNSLSLNFMPVNGLTLSGFGTYRNYEVRTKARDTSSFFVGPFDGDTETVGVNANYKLTKKTSLSAGTSRTFGRAEGTRDHEFGDVSLGLSHRLSETWSVSTRYRFFYLDEANNGNIDDYHANFLSVGLTGRF